MFLSLLLRVLRVSVVKFIRKSHLSTVPEIATSEIESDRQAYETCFGTSRKSLQVSREGIEPLVVHLAYFVTTVLQAATRTTTRSKCDW